MSDSFSNGSKLHDSYSRNDLNKYYKNSFSNHNYRFTSSSRSLSTMTLSPIPLILPDKEEWLIKES